MTARSRRSSLNGASGQKIVQRKESLLPDREDAFGWHVLRPHQLLRGLVNLEEEFLCLRVTITAPLSCLQVSAKTTRSSYVNRLLSPAMRRGLLVVTFVAVTTSLVTGAADVSRRQEFVRQLTVDATQGRPHRRVWKYDVRVYMVPQLRLRNKPTT